MRKQFNHSYNVDNRYRGLEAPTSPPSRKAQDNISSSRFLDSYVIRHINDFVPLKSTEFSRKGDTFGALPKRKDRELDARIRQYSDETLADSERRNVEQSRRNEYDSWIDEQSI